MYCGGSIAKSVRRSGKLAVTRTPRVSNDYSGAARMTERTMEQIQSILQEGARR